MDTSRSSNRIVFSVSGTSAGTSDKMESRWNVWYTCRDSEGWRMYSGAVVEGAFDVAWNVERHLKSGGRLLLYLPIYMKDCRAECGIYKE